MKPSITSFVCSVGAGLVVAAYSLLFHEGGETHYRLYYYTPAAIAAGALLADRMGDRKRWNGAGKVIDLVVSLLCLSRPIWGWPPASGHAFFAIHALMTGSSRVTRIFAVLLLIITLYAKIWVWRGDPTLWPGLGCGLVSGLLWRRVGGKLPA